MKVLNFEDSVYKANAIRKVLNQCGVAKIELVSNVEDGLQMLKNAEDGSIPRPPSFTCAVINRFAK